MSLEVEYKHSSTHFDIDDVTETDPLEINIVYTITLRTLAERVKAETSSQDYFNAIVLEANDDVILAEYKSGTILVGNKVSISTNT